MTHNDFDLSAVLEQLRSDESGDLVRQMVGFLYQALIDAEATEVVQAERHERTLSRTTQRNGSRPRLLTTKAGDVELKIPKLRKGSFFPSVLECRRRIDQALYAVVMHLRSRGLHAPGRRPGLGPRSRRRDLQVRGLADLRAARRGDERVPRSQPLSPGLSLPAL